MQDPSQQLGPTESTGEPVEDRWDKAVDSLPAVLDGLWLNIRVMLVCAVLIAILGLTLAVMRTVRGPVAFPLRLFATAYVDLFRGLPLLLVLFLLGAPAEAP